MDNKLVFYFSGFFSLLLYFTLLSLVFLNSSFFTLNRIGVKSLSDTFEVILTIDENKEDGNLLSSSMMQNIDSQTDSKLQDNEIQNFFQIKSNAKKYPVDLFENQPKKTATTQSPEDNSMYEQNMKDLNQITQELGMVKVKKSQKSFVNGINNDGYGNEVFELLSLNWRKYSYQKEITFRIKIILYASGKFDYVIVQKSGNIDYDNATILFLEKQKSIKYPMHQSLSPKVYNIDLREIR